MTNKTISLTIPNDDPIALHEFGAAMQRMAHSHGHPVVVPREVTDRAVIAAQTVITGRKSEINRPVDTSGTRDDVHDRLVELQRGVLVDTDKAQLAALGAEAPTETLADKIFEVYKRDTSDTDTTPSHLDSDGLPWDARIHASSKERNADDTWRARRKPSDMDAGQWAEFQGQVRTELRALMELPVEQEVAAVLGEQPEPVAPVVQDEPTPVVVEPVEPEPIVVTPPPVVALPAPVDPVVPVAPPAPTGTAPTEFVPFLQWITSSGITPEQVNVALAQHGLTAVPQLQQRPDLIPQVHATLAAGV